MKKAILFSGIIIFLVLAFSGVCAFAADKDWIGAGDAATWEDGKNWNPQGAPASVDDVTISLKDAYATATRTFEAKSVNIGGAASSTFATNDFIYGNITTDLPADEALYIRKGGRAVLRGQGTITLKGAFKNTEEALSGEESFMFQLY
jgi:subtilase family serine protease